MRFVIDKFKSKNGASVFSEASAFNLSVQCLFTVCLTRSFVGIVIVVFPDRTHYFGLSTGAFGRTGDGFYF